MSQRRASSSNESHSPSNASSQEQQSLRSTPLVIVSERGRHSEASRRIVRAQAARASAAQSRETRARNREDRTIREGPQSPLTDGPGVSSAQPTSSFSRASSTPHSPNPPLVHWVTHVLRLSSGSSGGGATLDLIARPQQTTDSGFPVFGRTSSREAALSPDGSPIDGERLIRRLPLALPRGFVALQQRLQLPDVFLAIVSRTACFDYASPGIEIRLNELLFDIVMASTPTGAGDPSPPSDPIQSHLRIACTCLAIFQGQRADGAVFARDRKYHSGLEAALAETMLLEPPGRQEPEAAEAALWAIFIISVTTGSMPNLFSEHLRTLFQDLHLDYWEQVRAVLLKFIYPGSYLDEPCKVFYEKLHNAQRVQG